jgi:membrane protein
MFSFRKFFKLGTTSYKDLGKQVLKEVKDEDCSEHAAAMAYYFLFAMFPFFLFLTTLIGLIPVPNLMEYLLTQASTMLPGDAFKLVEDNIRSLFMNKKEGLLSISIVLALWASSNAIVSIMDAMNKIYDVDEGRPFWKVRLVAIGLVIALSISFLVTLMLLMFGTKLGKYIADMINFGTLFLVAWHVVLIPVILFLLILAIALIYYFTPDVEHTWVWISPGACLVIPLWILMSLAFSYYVNNFGSYDKTYGSIGAVIILLLWLYLTGFIILIGACVNAVVEHNSAEGKEPGEKVAGERGETPERKEKKKENEQVERGEK